MCIAHTVILLSTYPKQREIPSTVLWLDCPSCLPNTLLHQLTRTQSQGGLGMSPATQRTELTVSSGITTTGFSQLTYIIIIIIIIII